LFHNKIWSGFSSFVVVPRTVRRSSVNAALSFYWRIYNTEDRPIYSRPRLNDRNINEPQASNIQKHPKIESDVRIWEYHSLTSVAQYKIRINVPLRRVLDIIFYRGKQYVFRVLSVFVDLGFRHAKRLRRIIYSHLWPVRLYNTFPHSLINTTIFGKMILIMKYVLIFLQLCFKYLLL